MVPIKMKDKSLLIWPPLITTSKLPLGIPSLAAYLKNNKIDNIEVIDLNTAYLRRMRLFFFLHIFNERYWKFVDNVSTSFKKATPTMTKKKRFRWKKIMVPPHRYMSKKVNELLDYLENKERRSIPWSLETILRFDFKDTHHQKRISSILNPIINKNKFSLIGISVIYPEQLFFAFVIAKVIKEEFGKEIYVLLGGAQVTKHINYITNSKGVYNFVDFFITDDGEEPLLKLLKDIPEKRFSDVPNLYFKHPDKRGGYEKSKKFFYLYPEDFVVPDFTGFDLDVYRDQMPILASKGCFWAKCNFCTYASMQEHRYYMSTVEKTLGIIKEMNRIYGVLRYRFVDDELPPRFMEALANNLSKDRLNIKWASNIILSREFENQDFCRILKDSGLFQVSIGLESISSRILNLMNKYHRNISEPEIKDILANLKGAGIRIGVYIIFGFPTETLDEARQTLNFLIENRDLYNRCMVQPFCLEDETPIFNNPEEFGIGRIYKKDKNYGERLGYRYEVLRGMTQEEAERFTYEEAIRALKKANVSVKSSKTELY